MTVAINSESFLKEIIDEEISQEPLSIYIHWPFCLAKCPYCDFNSHVSNSVNHSEFLAAYLKELDSFKNYFYGRTIHSIYFGGGTPSLMQPETVGALLDYLSRHSKFEQNIEITLEANPTSVEYNKFLLFKKAGINRVSIGIQSLISSDLLFLGREHSVAEALEAVEAGKSIFSRYSFDLIYGRPNQTLESWENELRQAMLMSEDHISLYQLTIEKGTKFYQLHKNETFTLPSEELSNDLYFLTDKILAESNFHKYEISNYAKNDQYSKHNLCYWKYNDYLGIGPGAHSRMRASNQKFYAFNTIYNPAKWLENLQNHNNSIQKVELLGKIDIVCEFILMNLRLKSGILQEDAIRKLGSTVESFIKSQTLDFLLREGLIAYNRQNFSATEKGFRLLDYVVRTLTNNLNIK